MRKKMSQKLLSAVLAAGMIVGLAACGNDGAGATTTTTDTTGTDTTTTDVTDTTDVAEVEVEDEDVNPYTVITDDAGNPIDLGGMEILIRDWWSTPVDEWTEPEINTEYQEEVAEYHKWLTETYNFTVKQVGISDWASTPQDFVDYSSSGGDENNYVFTVYDCAAITSAVNTGLAYDLNTIDCLDLSRVKYQTNHVAENYTYGDSIYAMYAGASEPRCGMYFNKKVLEDAGIDPDSIYDMQANGTWTWEAWEDLLAHVQRDTNNDGELDVFGMCANESVMTEQAVYSNGSEFVGRDADGKYVLKLQDDATIQALEWCVNIYNVYDDHDEPDANWDYYMNEFKSGVVAFFPEHAYAASGTKNILSDVTDFEIGFVFFPKGPNAKNDTYVNCWTNNPCMIPACYDEERAAKIAFAYDLWTDTPAGYDEDYLDLSNYRAGTFDARALEETIPAMAKAEHGMLTYHGMIPDLQFGPEFSWSINVGATVSEVVEGAASVWQAYIDAANK